MYHLRSDFRYRLVKLRDEIQCQLTRDEEGFSSPGFGNLMPCLHSVFTLLWCKRSSDLSCRKSSYTRSGSVDVPSVLVSKEFYERAKSALNRLYVLEHDGSDDLPF